MKKVAVITPFLAQGGLEKVAVTGAQELEKYFDITLIVFDTFKVDYPYDGKLIDLKVPFQNRNFLKRIISLIKIIFKLSKLKKHNKFDLIIVHGELANLAAVFSGRGNHIVVIHENRFKAIKDIQSKLFGLFSKFIYQARNTKKIVTVSKGIEDSFIRHLNLNENRIETIYNPFDISEIQKKANEVITEFTGLFNEDVLIVAARLSEPKGHRYLLQIFTELIQTKPDLKLLLLGDGELKDKLIMYAKGQGLKVFSKFSNDDYNTNYNVYFIGFQNNPYKYIANAKLFLMTSLWEGFGNTLVESMACGTPVISTDCESGPKEIIAPALEGQVTNEKYGRYGVMMPPLSIENDTLSRTHINMWCNTINNLLTDSQTLDDLKASGLKRTWEFDKSAIMSKWIDLMNGISGENKSNKEDIF